MDHCSGAFFEIPYPEDILNPLERNSSAPAVVDFTSLRTSASSISFFTHRSMESQINRSKLLVGHRKTRSHEGGGSLSSPEKAKDVLIDTKLQNGHGIEYDNDDDAFEIARAEPTTTTDTDKRLIFRTSTQSSIPERTQSLEEELLPPYSVDEEEDLGNLAGAVEGVVDQLTSTTAYKSALEMTTITSSTPLTGHHRITSFPLLSTSVRDSSLALQPAAPSSLPISRSPSPKRKKEPKGSVGGTSFQSAPSEAGFSSVTGSTSNRDTTSGSTGLRLGKQIKNFISPNYNTRLDQFRKLFKGVPESEHFISDYSCAYQREILVHGRMYLGQHHVCFHANIFSWETYLEIPFSDIKLITKERTAKIIPNAIQIQTTSGDKYFFTSFGSRDKAYLMLFRIWQYSLQNKAVSPQEMWTWAQQGYQDADISCSEGETQEGDTTDPSQANNESVSVISAGSSTSSRSRRGNQRTPIVITRDSPDATPRVQTAPTAQEQLIRQRGPIPMLKTSQSTPAFRGGQPTTPGNGVVKGQTPWTLGRTDTVAEEELEMDVQEQQSSLIDGPAPLELDESSETEGEVSCPCASHLGRQQLDGTYPISVEQMFVLIFTDSQFHSDFMGTQKKTGGGPRFFDYKATDWKVNPETGANERNVSYSVTINHAMMAQKSCHSTEKQVCHRYGRAGDMALIQKETYNHGVPYADNFYVSTSYCISRVAANVCRIKVHSGLVYTKNVWGIVKTFIERSTYQGLSEHYTSLGKALHEECRRLGFTVDSDNTRSTANDEESPLANGTEQGSKAATKKTLVKRRGAAKGRLPAGTDVLPSASGPEQPLLTSPHTAVGGIGSDVANVSTAQRYGSSYISMETVNRATLFIMLCILLLNGVLVYKVFSPELNQPQAYSATFLDNLHTILSRNNMAPDDIMKLYEMHRREAALKSIQQTEANLNRILLYLKELKTDVENAKLSLQSVGGEKDTHSCTKTANSQQRESQKE